MASLPAVPGAINVPAPLTGKEIVAIATVGPQSAQTTTQAIADLAGSSGSGQQTINTAISTAGDGLLTATAITGGVITRTGPSGAFTDTTDTAAAIVALIENAFVGQSFFLRIRNTTAFAETLAAGSGVTLSGSGAVVPANSTASYLVTLTSLTAVSIFGINVTANISLPATKFTTAALSVGTLAAGAITGAAMCYLTNTGATPGAQTVRTAAQMLADIPGAAPGMSFGFRIINTGAGTLTLTADGGTTVTLTGTATVAQNITRDYTLTFNTATTATIQSVGSGVSP